MATAFSIRPLIWVQTFARAFHIHLVTWDNPNQRFTQSRSFMNIYLRKFNMMGIVVLNMATALTFACVLIQATDLKPGEPMPLTFLAMVYILATSVQVHSITIWKQVPGLLNSYANLWVAAESHAKQMKDKALQRIGMTMRLLLGFAVASIVFGLPAAFIPIHYEIFCFRLLHFRQLWKNLLLSCHINFLGAMDWVIVLSYCFIILMHTSCCSGWQRFCLRTWFRSESKGRKLSEARKYMLHLEYRAQQVQHIIAHELVADTILPFIIPCAEILVILVTYAAIALYHQLPVFFLMAEIFVALFAVISLRYMIQLAVEVTTNSSVYMHIPKSRMAFQLTQMDHARFRSYRSMQWNIGHSFTLCKDTFPKILQNVIIDTVVNLLVGHR